MAGSPKKRARRLAAAGVVPETAPDALRSGARERTPSAPIPPSPGDLDKRPPETDDKAPAWLKEAAARADAARRVEEETLAVLALASPKREPGTIGAPTLYTEAHCIAAIRLGEIGMDVTEIAVRFQVRRQTLYEWAERHPAFADALARAHEASEAYHHAMIREQIARPSMAGNAAAYLSYMARRFPHWREKQEVEHSGTIHHEDRVSRRMEMIAERRKALTARKGADYEVVGEA